MFNKKTLFSIILLESAMVIFLLLFILIQPKKVIHELTHLKPSLGYHTSTPSYFIPFAYKSIVQAASDETGVPVWLLARLIKRESNWNSSLVNINADGTKDLGICQLNEKYIPDFEWRYNHGSKIDAFNPDTSIYVCAKLLNALYKNTGNWVDAVGAYNCGLTRYKTGDIPDSTLRHIDAVFGGI
jgi:soluble lytic murein transglycosylase-like protein